MLDSCYHLLNHLARTFIKPGLNPAGMLWLCLATLIAVPAIAAEPCSDLGIKTVNWKSPDSSQTGVLILHVQPGCVAEALGVRAGEVIAGFNGKPIGNQYDLEQLAGNHAADQAFSLMLKDGAGQSRMLQRAALPVHPVSEIPHEATRGVSGDWLSWFKWAGLFLVLSLTLTPEIGRAHV